jgi:hypothetical protein
MLFDEQSDETYECTKVCHILQKKLDKKQSIPLEDVDKLVLRLKDESTRLKKLIYSR